jgi:hypothetical protein
MPNKLSFRDILLTNRQQWDHDGTNKNVRDNFTKVTRCRTPALGAEVYVSEGGEEVVVPHTCKSSSCSGCGRLSSMNWIEDIKYELPAIPYAGLCFTMPSILWAIFRDNSHLMEALPALGASVLQDWVKKKYAADVMILVVSHSFGKALLFKPHLHILASRTGLDQFGNGIVHEIKYPKNAILPAWRHVVVDYLRKALAEGTVNSPLSDSDLDALLVYQRDMWWNIDVQLGVDKHEFVAYIGRYLRRPTIADYNLISHDEKHVKFWTKETRLGGREAVELPPAEFLSRVSDHMAGRYKNKVRYFGLLSPGSKHIDYKTFLALLGQVRGLKPRRLRYADKIKIHFHRDPLHYANGVRMRWSRNVPAEKPSDSTEHLS